MDTINIFTTIDPGWMPYAWMFIASVRANTNSPVRYTVLTSAPVDSNRFESWATLNNVDLRILHFDKVLTERSKDFVVPSAPEDRYSRCVYWGRYCAEYVFDAIPDRLIYADVDMLAMSDITPLMTVDLGGASIGAVRYPNSWVGEKIGVPNNRYVNNGLLVFDTRKFNGNACVLGMQEALVTHETIFGPQCALNIAMASEIELIDVAWNVQGEYRKEFERAARIVHFTGDVKPWHTLSKDSLRWDVRRLLFNIGCKDAWRPDNSPKTFAKLIARNVLDMGRLG